MPSLADYLLANTSGGNFGTMSPGEEAVAVTPGSVLDAAARSAYRLGATPRDAMRTAVQPTGGMVSDVDMARGLLNEADIGKRTGEGALSMMGLGGAFPAEANALNMGIKAYHGSPHDFERFDISKIGTGEGAQSYGHGLYFAENPTTAESYKKGIPAPNKSFAESRARQALIENGEDRNKAIASLDDPDAIALIKSGYEVPRGKTYEVDINADPEHFLDWDKPLSEQSTAAQTKFAEAIGQPNLARHIELSKQLEDIASRPAAEHALHPEWTQQWDKLNAERNSLGVDPRIMNQTGAQLYESSKLVPGEFRDKEIAAQKLREAGIPGIKYLDQGSRGPGTIYNVGAPRADFGPYTPFTKQSDAEAHAAMLRKQGFHDAEIKEQKQPQTSNYVVFDDKLIDILKKYGIAAGIIPAAGAAFDRQQQ